MQDLSFWGIQLAFATSPNLFLDEASPNASKFTVYKSVE